ncbi:hypothetical protein O181_130060 [Austropuccinia psidii MF-1]|uniref:Uncharacterized protein n=1 Tax=Austropuccinia psidii MF-1 TaxID=1389203 RepID=A0A9Q3QAL0_9BASI|nr:hypothetical protein [Austropuccinia psidii MF-1]
MKPEHIESLFQCKEEFLFNNETLGEIKGHELKIKLNAERSYPPLLMRPHYPDRHRDREALETHINEVIKPGVLRNAGYNEKLEVKAPGILTLNN